MGIIERFILVVGGVAVVLVFGWTAIHPSIFRAIASASRKFKERPSAAGVRRLFGHSKIAKEAHDPAGLDEDISEAGSDRRYSSGLRDVAATVIELRKHQLSAIGSDTWRPATQVAATVADPDGHAVRLLKGSVG